jgi:hypothetical protein
MDNRNEGTPLKCRPKFTERLLHAWEYTITIPHYTGSLGLTSFDLLALVENSSATLDCRGTFQLGSWIPQGNYWRWYKYDAQNMDQQGSRLNETAHSVHRNLAYKAISWRRKTPRVANGVQFQWSTYFHNLKFWAWSGFTTLRFMFFDAFIDRPDYNGRRIHLLIIWAACVLSSL